MRLNTLNELETYHGLGNLFENLVVLELYKHQLNHGLFDQMYFFRDKHGQEVDVLIDQGSRKLPIEIKAASSFHQDFLKGIRYFQKLLKDSDLLGPSAVIYSGESLDWQPQETSVLNYGEVGRVFEPTKNEKEE